MKGIAIKKENEDIIMAEIAKAEGRATARTVDMRTIERIIKDATTINGRCIPKCHLHGTRIMYDGGEHFPNAYRHIPYSTQFRAENRRGQWYLMEVSRGICHNRSTGGHVVYSDTAKEWILKMLGKIY